MPFVIKFYPFVINFELIDQYIKYIGAKMLKFAGCAIRMNGIMTRFHKIFLMMVTAAMAFSACAPKADIPVPEQPLEECVYGGDRTEFAVWSPDADAAQLKLYHSAQDTSAFATFDMKKSRDGLWKITVKEDIKGAFYAFADVRSTGLDDEAFALKLLKEHSVAVVPGSAFGQSGAGFVRLSYATSMEKLHIAVERIGKALGRRGK